MNDRQREAIYYINGPLLILAGAGSGKTTVLVNRIANLICCEQACRPWQVLAITFTNKAAGELKDRLCSMLGEAGNDIWASTFHSTCARMLRRDGDRIGFTRHFTIYDTDDSRRLMKDCQKTLKIEEKLFRPRRFFRKFPVQRITCLVLRIMPCKQVRITGFSLWQRHTICMNAG